jgi:hypothetical protein
MCQGEFHGFQALSFSLIFKDYVRKNSNSFLEACYWNLKLALQTGAANEMKKIVQYWMPFSNTISGSQSTNIKSRFIRYFLMICMLLKG